MPAVSRTLLGATASISLVLPLLIPGSILVKALAAGISVLLFSVLLLLLMLRSHQPQSSDFKSVIQNWWYELQDFEHQYREPLGFFKRNWVRLRSRTVYDSTSLRSLIYDFQQNGNDPADRVWLTALSTLPDYVHWPFRSPEETEVAEYFQAADELLSSFAKMKCATPEVIRSVIESPRMFSLVRIYNEATSQQMYAEELLPKTRKEMIRKLEHSDLSLNDLVNFVPYKNAETEYDWEWRRKEEVEALRRNPHPLTSLVEALYGRDLLNQEAFFFPRMQRKLRKIEKTLTKLPSGTKEIFDTLILETELPSATRRSRGIKENRQNAKARMALFKEVEKVIETAKAF